MIEPNARTRVRWLWLLTAATAAYALANVIGFFIADGFGAAWFVAGLTVYGMIFVTGVTLAILGPAREEPETEPELEAEVPEPEEPETLETDLREMTVLDHETLYRTRTGHLLRVRFATKEDERSMLFAVTQDQVLPVPSVEEKLDELDFEPPAIDDQREVDDALERRASQRRGSQEDSLSVELLDQEILYETPTGKLVEATYRTNGDELSGLFAVVGDQVTPIRDVEAHLDRVQTDEMPVETEAEFERVLEAHRAETNGEEPIQEQVIQE